MQQVLYTVLDSTNSTDDNKKSSVTRVSPIIFDHCKVIIIDIYTKVYSKVGSVKDACV